MKNNLRNLRDAKRYTLREVAEKTGINYAVLSRLENEVQDISGQYLSLLADFYKAPTDYILGRDTKTLPQTIIYKEREVNYQSIIDSISKLSKDDLLKLFGAVDGELRRRSEQPQNGVAKQEITNNSGIKKETNERIFDNKHPE